MKYKGNKKDESPCDIKVTADSAFCYRSVAGWWYKSTRFLADILGVKRRFLIWLVLFSLVIFFVQGYANYKYNRILDSLELKADIEVEISPFLHTATFGDYLPLIVTNTGDYTLEDISILIHSCEMPAEYYELYSLPLVPSHSERSIPFGNKDVVSGFKKGNCYPFAGKNRSFASFTFNPQIIMEGETCTNVSTGCGSCPFNAKISARYYQDGKNETFRKNVSSYFDSPVKRIATISRKGIDLGDMSLNEPIYVNIE